MKTNLHWIQALRGLAALLVLFFHMSPHWDLVPMLANLTGPMKWWFSGVDIFFALSGFVVYRSARNTVSTTGLWPFIKRRLQRIYFGYWPVLLLMALITVFVYNSSLPPLKQMVFSTLLLYPNIWDNWLPPAWSLTMEIYFYLWIALIALLPQRHQVKAIVCAMLLLIAWGVGCLIFDTASVFNGQQPLRYLLTGLGLEFLAGALVAHAHASGSRIFKSPTLTIPICIVLMAAGVSLGMTSSYFDRVEIMRAASFGVMGAAALVLALTLEQTPLTPPAWLVRVGDASYSLYLLHTFLLDASGRMRVWLQIDNPTVLLFFMLALPVAIVLLSMVWYRRVERPIMEASFRGKSLALPKKTRCESPG